MREHTRSDDPGPECLKRVLEDVVLHFEIRAAAADIGRRCRSPPRGRSPMCWASHTAIDPAADLQTPRACLNQTAPSARCRIVELLQRLSRSSSATSR